MTALGGSGVLGAERLEAGEPEERGGPAHPRTPAAGGSRAYPAGARLPGGEIAHELRRRALQEADPAALTLAEAASLIRSGDLSPVELVEAVLARIRRWEPELQAYNVVLEDDVRAAARRVRDGRVRGALHGIPLAIKDNLYTAGVVTSANSHIFADFVPTWNAEGWRRLEAEGALLVGKTQMGPLATSRATTPDGQVTTRSAWAPDDSSISPGGSSSGSATAVAAGLALGATGTQTGGSITNPAAAQGLTGLKPTMGRVSLRGVIPLTYTRDHLGPLARDALDAAILLQAMAGPDPGDPRTMGLPRPGDYVTAATPVRRQGRTVLRRTLRIGVPPGVLDAPPVPEVPADADPEERRRIEGVRARRQRQGAEVAGRRAFVDTMRRLGAEIVEVPHPRGWDALTSRAFNNVRLPERAEPFMEHLRTDVRRFGVVLSTWINGLLLPGTEYLKGQRAKLVLLRRLLDETFAACDVVLQLSPIPFDMVGLPLISFPVGMVERSGRSLPHGMLVGGAPFEEDRLLEVAAAWQDVTGWHRRRPPLTSDAGGAPGGTPEATGAGGGRRGPELALDVLDVEAQSE